MPRFGAVLVVPAALVFAALHADPLNAEWVEVNPGSMSRGCGGVAWGDFDGDGDQDLYVTRIGNNHLFRNDGAGDFVDVAVGTILADPGHGRSAPWADFDDDEDLDLYLANEGEANALLRNEGIGGFTDATAGPLGDQGQGVGVCWGDYDLDGDVDLYLTNYGPESNRLFRNDGGYGFADATKGPLVEVQPSDAAAWGDYDDDGDLDLYVSVRIGANKLLRNDLEGGFADVTSGPLGDSGPTEGVAWGDYDNDGDLDLYFTSEFSVGRLLRNEGNGEFSDATSGPLGGPASYGVTWGDYDNDGDLDLYVTPSKLMRNDGDGAFVDVTEGSLGMAPGGVGAAWADYDDDGDLDLFTASNTNLNRLFRNDLSPDNHWLGVDLKGTISNVAGIGARVRVVTGSQSQIREVSGGHGFCSQNALTAHFGLSSADVVDTVEVRWPSGRAEWWDGIDVDQRIELRELSGTGLADPGNLSRPMPASLSVCPNPVRYDATFTGHWTETVFVEIYDPNGRLIDLLRPTGQSATWLPESAARSGVYFARLRGAGGAQVVRFLVVK